MYAIELRRQAQKALDKLPEHDFDAVIEAVKYLAYSPDFNLATGHNVISHQQSRTNHPYRHHALPFICHREEGVSPTWRSHKTQYVIARTAFSGSWRSLTTHTSSRSRR